MDDSEATPTPSPAADQAAIDVAHLIKVYKTTRAVVVTDPQITRNP